MTESKLVKANEKIAEKVCSGFQKIEDKVTGTYQKIKDSFVESYLTKDGLEETYHPLFLKGSQESPGNETAL